ncbi:MAG: hypothetical protein WD669_03040 [Pirellulales bacterium]
MAWDRPLIVIASIAAVATLDSVRAEEFSPYRARVVAASAPVHSGPGENFYPTDTLAEGELVDVYRQQANGWCAIRPPEGSFSWVFGRHLKLRGKPEQTNGTLAEIDKEEVASRIGSRLSARRNAVQVRLKKGETVQVIGQDSSDGETWYKVAPPAGEFRWIHVKAIERTGPIPAGSSKPRHDERESTASAASNAVVKAAGETPVAETTPATTAVPAKPSGAPPAATAPTAKQTPSDQWRAAPEKAPNEPITAPPLAEPQAEKEAEKVSGAEKGAEKVSGTFSGGNVPAGPVRTVADLELRLSRMVAEPPTSWNVEPLKTEAEAMLTQAQTAVERNAIQATIAKLDRFAAIERRYRGLAGGAPTAGQQFDAVGVLRPVNSRRPGAPPFALVDERGQVLSFVTPTPGVNLQPFLGQRIGVTGNRGYIPEFQRAHVVAGRVAPVSERMVR